MSSGNDNDERPSKKGAKEIQANNNITNKTNDANQKNKKQQQAARQKHQPETSPLKKKVILEIINIEHDKSDDETVGAGNSKPTPHPTTPKNVTTIISKKHIGIQIKLEQIKTTKPVDAINACINQCKAWPSKIQEIEPSFKLHRVVLSQ
jgi:hypothetical protein